MLPKRVAVYKGQLTPRATSFAAPRRSPRGAPRAGGPTTPCGCGPADRPPGPTRTDDQFPAITSGYLRLRPAGRVGCARTLSPSREAMVASALWSVTVGSNPCSTRASSRRCTACSAVSPAEMFRRDRQVATAAIRSARRCENTVDAPGDAASGPGQPRAGFRNHLAPRGGHQPPARLSHRRHHPAPPRAIAAPANALARAARPSLHRPAEHGREHRCPAHPGQCHRCRQNCRDR